MTTPVMANTHIMESYVQRALSVQGKLAGYGIPIRVQTDHDGGMTGLSVELSTTAILCLLEMLADDCQEHMVFDEDEPTITLVPQERIP